MCAARKNNDYNPKGVIKLLRGAKISKESFDTIALTWSQNKEVMDAARLAYRE